MYFDNQPCRVCGAEVRLREHRRTRAEKDPDGTVDDRVCTNDDCPTRTQSGPEAPRA